jgi:ribonucleoside-triphosphate reductase
MSLNNDLAEAAHKQYWLTEVYDKSIRDGYSNGIFHIHNLGHLSTYCVGWSLEDLLRMGFKGQYGRQTSNPAKHFRSALGHIYNFLYTLQGESAGAQALSNFDTYLAPFIHYDDLEQDEVDQLIQEFIFNMNVPTRVGGQQPFTNITLDQVIPKFMADDSVLVGGKLKDDVYGSFQDEMDMLNEAWWKQRIAGDGEGRPQPFPIETLNVTKDFNWDDKLLFKAVALRGTPYFSNFINSDMNPEDVRSMCCRLRIDNTILNKRGGGFFGSSPLTGSIGVVTLNLPLMGYLSKSKEEFFEKLEEAMDLAKDSLEMKRVVLGNLTKNIRLYPYSMVYLDGVQKRFGEYWKNHFSTIGLIGMNEACLNLLGVNIIDPDGLEFAQTVLDFMRIICLRFQEETDNMYNLEASPAESTAYKLALYDRTRFPDIITAGIPEAPYYTNSTQLPVDCDKPLGFHLSHQNKLQPKYTGGTVLHIWNGESTPRWEAVSKLVNRIATNYNINYFTYSPTTSVCPAHGLIAGEYHECPTCGGPTEVWQRVTGYFSPLAQWNIGKKQEFKERHPFKVS